MGKEEKDLLGGVVQTLPNGTVVRRRVMNRAASSLEREPLPFPLGSLPKSVEVATLTTEERQLTGAISQFATVDQIFSSGLIFTVSPIGQSLQHGVRLPNLPPNYYFKGGAARERLRRLLHPSHPAIPLRDYDLVRFVHTPDHLDHELSVRFMLDDYQFGRGVEVVENISTYLATRDLTVNEVLGRDQIMVATFRALTDLITNRIAPTPFVTDAAGVVDGRTFAKAIRLMAEGSVAGTPVNVEGLRSSSKVSPFDIALNLDRALAAGEIQAKEYLFLIWNLGYLLPQRQAPPSLVQAIHFLATQLPMGINLFRNLPLSVVAALA